jgi:hypothetical protein
MRKLLSCICLLSIHFLSAQKPIPKYPLTLFEKSMGKQTPTYFEIIDWWKDLDQKSDYVKMLDYGHD